MESSVPQVFLRMEADDSVPADESTFSESHAYDSKARSRSKHPRGGGHGREKIATPTNN